MDKQKPSPDTNEVLLRGRIGYNFKFSKTARNRGREYAMFAVEIDDPKNSREDITRHQVIHVKCFDRDVVEYLRAAKPHEGMRVQVEGFVSAYKGQIKGVDIVNNAVCARKVTLFTNNKLINKQKEQQDYDNKE